MNQAVRFMASPSLSLRLDVYDGADVLIATYPMPEITTVAGVYRADVAVVSPDMWGIVIDASNGDQLNIVRIQPSIQSGNTMLDDLHIILASDMSIDGVSGTLTAQRGADSRTFLLLNADGSKASSPSSASGRKRQ